MNAMSVSAALLGLLAAPLVQAAGLTPLSDAQLGKVTAQEGITLDLGNLINVGVNSSGDYNVLLTKADRRIAFQFLNRYGADGVKGGTDDEWIVWKDFFGVLKLTQVDLDAAQTPASNSAYADTRAAAVNRFYSDSDNCLLGTAADPAACVAHLTEMPYLQFTFNQPIEMFLHANIATEYGVTGYLGTTQTSAAISMVTGDTGGSGPGVADGAIVPAKIHVEGSMGLYGY